MPNFLDQMKPSDWINIAGLGLGLAGGISGGKAASRSTEQASRMSDLAWLQNQQQARQDEFNRQLQLYNAQLGARSGLGAFWTQTNLDRMSGRQAALNAMPLGAEQMLAARMARARGFSDVAQNFQPAMPASADIAGLIRPTSNALAAITTPDYLASISPEATARSIAERRKAIAGVDPTFQFGSMGDYGVPNLGGEVTRYGQSVEADRLGRENKVLALLTQQMQAASALPKTTQEAMAGPSQPGPQQPAPTPTEQPKKTSWWKKVLNVAATAAPIVAAPFTGGTSLALIGAGSGALKGALSGGGVKGALTGAAMGAATSALGGGAAGAGATRGAEEAASAAIKRAILNPRALTQLGGAAIGGPTEQVTQMVSPFLPGAKAYQTFNNKLTPQSLPTSMQQAAVQAPGAGQLQLPSRPTVAPYNGLPTVTSVAPQTGKTGITVPVGASNILSRFSSNIPAAEGRLPNGQWNMFGQIAVPLPDVNTTTQPAVTAQPATRLSFEANKVGGMPLVPETPAQKAAFLAAMAPIAGTYAAGVGPAAIGAARAAANAPAAARMGEIWRNLWLRPTEQTVTPQGQQYILDKIASISRMTDPQKAQAELAALQDLLKVFLK